MTEFIEALKMFFKADKYVEMSGIEIVEITDEKAVVERFIDYLEGKVGSGNGLGGGSIYRLKKELTNACADGIIGGAE